MSFFGIFGGRSLEQREEKGDSLFEAGDYGLAKMEYENLVEKIIKGERKDPELEKRVIEKLDRTRELLAVRHREEGLEIMESGYLEAAADSFRLALELTHDPEMTEELKGLLKRTSDFSDEGSDACYIDRPAGRTEDKDERTGEDDLFDALLSGLPEPVRDAYYSYGDTFRKGYLALNEADFNLAADMLYEAMEESGRHSYVPIELAAAYLNLERFDEARKFSEDFVRNFPEWTQGYQILCESLWALGRFDAALEWLDSSPAEVAGSLPMLLLKGDTLVRGRRFDEAAGLFEQELELNGWQPDMARALAMTYEEQGEKEDARDIFSKLLESCRACGAKQDLFSKKRFSELSFELGDRSPNLLGLYLSLVQEDPSMRAQYYRKISAIYEAQGNSVEAGRFADFAQRAMSE